MGDLMQHAPAELVAGRSGRVPLPGDSPELPADGRFEHNRAQDWGDRPALPQVSEEAGHSPSNGEGAKREVRASSDEPDGTGDGADTVTPSSPSDEASPEGSETAPPEDDLDDEPAASWRWKNATAVGLNGPKALKMVHKLFPDNPPTAQSFITNRQLQAVIEEARDA
jgi:hypothetical protein